MTRVRLLVALLAALLGSSVGLPVLHADSYIYDGPLLARVEDHVTTTADIASPQVSVPSAGRVEKWSVAFGASTTFSRSFTATNSFEPSPKHDQSRPGVGAQPTNGQSALTRSVQVSETSARRVGVDAGSGEIVVFDETYPGQCIFHGHVRAWDQLTQKMQSALYKAGLTDLKGRIL